MSDRRFIRDTVANEYKPSYIAERDRRLAWLDKVAAIGYPYADEELNERPSSIDGDMARQLGVFMCGGR